MDLLGGLEHRLDLGLYLGKPDVKLFLVMQRSQPLLVVGDPERRNSLLLRKTLHGVTHECSDILTAPGRIEMKTSIEEDTKIK